jgi:hypothetical protein
VHMSSKLFCLQSLPKSDVLNNYGTRQVRLATRLWLLRVAIAWHSTSLIEWDGASDLDCNVHLQSQLDP